MGRRLRRRRRLLGLSLDAVARQCETTFQQIQKYELGSTAMSAARLWKIAAALEAPISYFFDGVPGSVLEAAGAGKADAAPGGEDDEVTEIIDAFNALEPDQRARLLHLMNQFAAGRDV